eukprot:7668669-Pyramimonas_sp.AAC.1
MGKGRLRVMLFGAPTGTTSAACSACMRLLFCLKGTLEHSEAMPSGSEWARIGARKKLKRYCEEMRMY